MYQDIIIPIETIAEAAGILLQSLRDGTFEDIKDAVEYERAVLNSFSFID